MEIVEFCFMLDGKEASRTYKVSNLSEAKVEFQQEFPDESTRPRIFRLSTRHIEIKQV